MRIEKIPNFPNYTIDELGNVYSIKKDRYLKPFKTQPKVDTLYVQLTNNGNSQYFQVAKLVLMVFQPSQTKINTFAIHKDLELENCANFNLERGTRGDRKRMFNEIRKKVRGVYEFNYGKKNYRAVIKTLDKQTKTIGYYKNYWYAQYMFNKTYKQMYGKLPY